MYWLKFKLLNKYGLNGVLKSNVKKSNKVSKNY